MERMVDETNVFVEDYEEVVGENGHYLDSIETWEFKQCHSKRCPTQEPTSRERSLFAPTERPIL